MIAYYALYEYLHYCMHLPKNRRFERTRFFQFVQTHHRLHHLYYMRNLNVVVPIADFVLRTRIPLSRADLFDKLERTRVNRLRQAEESVGALVGASEVPIGAAPEPRFGP